VGLEFFVDVEGFDLVAQVLLGCFVLLAERVEVFADDG